MRRMDRYKDENENRVSRLDKNQDLYQNLSSNTIYANVTDVVNANAFEINNRNNMSVSHTTREDYQKMMKYQNVEPVARTKKELDDFNYLYQRNENKVYDINSVLEEARKNRKEVDQLDEKRKLKNNAYNILSGMNKDELEKYREEKKKKIMTSEEEIRDLIDTIASKTLAGEIDKATSVDLLSDLMATSILDKVDDIESITEKQQQEEMESTSEIRKDSEEGNDDDAKTEDIELSLSQQILSSEEVEEINQKNEEVPEEKTDKDSDFYTRSMDLSEKDFDLSDEFKEKPLPIFVKILLFLLIIAVIAVAGYFIYQRIH